MLHGIHTFADSEGLWAHGDHLLLAVSGGADSVSLTHLLHELSGRNELTLSLAHMDHGLRGKDSAEDALFVQSLAEQLGLACHVKKMNIASYASRHQLSIEMAARECRYQWFRDLAHELDVDAIVVAHTADDQAETVLLRLVRGSGGSGLAGMAPRREQEGVAIIRPLLQCRGNELRTWLTARGLSWREDVSNQSREFLRNRVRHDVIPLLEKELNPKVTEALVRAASLLRADEKWLSELSLGILNTCRQLDGSLDGVRLVCQHEAAATRVLRQWLLEQGVDLQALSAGVTGQLLDFAAGDQGSAYFPLEKNRVVERRYGALYVVPTPGKNDYRYELAVPGVQTLREAGVRVRARRAKSIRKVPAKKVGVYPVGASISAERLGGKSLTLRNWRPGDRIRPIGMTGSRKLKEIFADAKVPRGERSRIPIITCEDEVIYIPGYRIAADWAVEVGHAVIDLDFTPI